jgi:galactokinase
MDLLEKVRIKFLHEFNEEPIIVRSPGRVNLIGEHTDYNNGFVLPAAIDLAIYIAISKREDSKCKIFAFDLDDYFEFDLNDINKAEKNWPNYLLGVIDQLQKNKYCINGFNCVFGGTIPIGAGLSSSAALEAGLIFSLNKLYDLNIEKIDMVGMAQKAENEFVGVNCGIMDQFINIFGKEGNVLQIDCRSLDYKYFPFIFNDVSVVLFNTKVSHSLASSEYNQRRKECSNGVGVIQKDYPDVESLRDVTIEMLESYKDKLDPIVYRRCKYAVEENIRLLNACESLLKKDLKTFGNYMYQTHDGLSKDYEVSCPELDFLVEQSKQFSSVYGARMMGGGFGGCTINLVENSSIDEVVNIISKVYQEKFGKEPGVYITHISNGTELIN